MCEVVRSGQKLTATGIVADFHGIPFCSSGKTDPGKNLAGRNYEKNRKRPFFHDSFGAMRLSTVQQLMGTGSCKTGRMRRRSERGSNRRTGGPFPVVRQEGLLCFAGSDVLAAVVESEVRGTGRKSVFGVPDRNTAALYFRQSASHCRSWAGIVSGSIRPTPEPFETARAGLQEGNSN